MSADPTIQHGYADKGTRTNGDGFTVSWTTCVCGETFEGLSRADNVLDGPSRSSLLLKDHCIAMHHAAIEALAAAGWPAG